MEDEKKKCSLMISSDQEANVNTREKIRIYLAQPSMDLTRSVLSDGVLRFATRSSSRASLHSTYHRTDCCSAAVEFGRTKDSTRVPTTRFDFYSSTFSERKIVHRRIDSVLLVPLSAFSTTNESPFSRQMKI